jgi:shikimate dehydrogenase
MNFLPALTGSFSIPAGDNPTVVMMEKAYAHHGIHARYINMEVTPENLADAVRGAKAQGYVGFNCSLPHKVAVIEHLDGLAESARIIGAVNCAVKRGTKWIGENTDGKGFLSSLEEVTEPAGKHVIVLGAGGASRAICVELALAGAAKLTLVNRSEARGRELFEVLKKSVIGTPGVGRDVRVPIALETLQPHMVAADVIPNPPKTRFLIEAETCGCRTLDGLGMLINQGATNLEYWTGIHPDKAVMRAALEEVFAAT